MFHFEKSGKQKQLPYKENFTDLDNLNLILSQADLHYRLNSHKTQKLKKKHQNNHFA